MQTQDYFKEIDKKDKAQVRALFIKHTITMHPDQGGDEKEFKLLKDQYDALMQDKQADTTSKEHVVMSNTVVLGRSRQVRKKRPTEPGDVVRIMHVSLQELYKGFTNDISYTRNVHKHDRLIQQEINIKDVPVYSHLLNDKGEIVYKGCGDKGLYGDDGDLVLVTKFDDDSISIDYTTPIPTVVEERVLRTWDKTIEIEFPSDDGVKKKTYDITYETTSMLFTKSGLKFRTESNHLVRGNYRVEIKRI